jgi:predicted amidohydrolase YtcJ
MAFQGEYFIQRYGQDAADATPPIRKILETGVPVGAGTDATRVASFNPWVSLYWLNSGKTVGGTALSSEKNCLSREEALSLYTSGSAWFSGEQKQKGTLNPGQFADLIVLILLRRQFLPTGRRLAVMWLLSRTSRGNIGICTKLRLCDSWCSLSLLHRTR